MPENPLWKKVRQLRAELEKAEAAYRTDVERRQAMLAEELAEAGLDAPRRTVRKAGRRTCSICGKQGHNARTCPKKDKK